MPDMSLGEALLRLAICTIALIAAIGLIWWAASAKYGNSITPADSLAVTCLRCLYPNPGINESASCGACGAPFSYRPPDEARPEVVVARQPDGTHGVDAAVAVCASVESTPASVGPRAGAGAPAARKPNAVKATSFTRRKGAKRK